MYFISHSSPSLPPTAAPPQDHLEVQAAKRAFQALNTPFEVGNTFFYLNFATPNTATEGAATTLYDLEPTADMLATANLLSSKGFIASDGYCIMSEEVRDALTHYAAYASKNRLVSPDALEHVIFVKDATQVMQVFSMLATLFEETQTDSPRVLFYHETGKAHELAVDAGINVEGAGRMVAESVIDHLSDKSNLRDIITQLCGEQAFAFPRIRISSSHPNDTYLATKLEEASRFYQDSDFSPENKLLFVQVVRGAGGCGNAIVKRQEDGSLFFSGFGEAELLLPPSTDQYEKLAQHLQSLSLDLEVTPYLSLTHATTYGIMIVDGEHGPEDAFVRRTQLLDHENNSFRAGVGDMNDHRQNRSETAQELETVVKLTQHLREQGYRGHFDLDAYEYINPQGEQCVSYAETNLRRDAPTFLLSVIARHGTLSEQFARGELSYLADDHMHLSPSLFEAAHNQRSAINVLLGTEFLADYLSSHDIPLVSEDSPYGIVFLSPPMRKPDGGVDLSIGIISTSDSEKYELYARTTSLLNEAYTPAPLSVGSSKNS